MSTLAVKLDPDLTVLSQDALSVTLQESVPPPVLLTVTVWLAGLLPPAVPEKARLVGLRPIAGGTGAVLTVRLTGIVCGLLLALGSETVIAAL